MITRLFGLCLLLVISSVSVVPQTQQPSQQPSPQPSPQPSRQPSPQPSPAVEKGSYDALLEKVKKGDRTVDFTALRIAFYDSPNYNPHTPMLSYRPLYGALAQKNYAEAIKVAQSVLEKNFVEVNAHMVAQIAYQETGDTDRAEFHKFVADGLLNSIKGKSDGKSMDTAFQVISINEEYGLLRSLELRPIKQALVQDKGHFFDALTVVDPKTNQQSVVYFNVDKVFGWKSKT